MRDNVLTYKAQSALLTAGGSRDVQVRSYNGEIFAVGVVDTLADRDRVIRAMRLVLHAAHPGLRPGVFAR